MTQMKGTNDESQRRAKAGGEYGANGEWYEGGKYIATKDRAKSKVKYKPPTGRQQIERGVWDVPPKLGENQYAMSVFAALAGVHHYDYDSGRFSLNREYAEYWQNQSNNSGVNVSKELQAEIDAYNSGARWAVWRFTENGMREFTGSYLNHSKEHEGVVMSQNVEIKQVKVERTYLDIDYENREIAKAHGAKYDMAQKKWYVHGIGEDKIEAILNAIKDKEESGKEIARLVYKYKEAKSMYHHTGYDTFKEEIKTILPKLDGVLKEAQDKYGDFADKKLKWEAGLKDHAEILEKIEFKPSIELGKSR